MSRKIEAPLRLGIVPYLNVQPLIWRFRKEPSGEAVEIRAARPSDLAEELQRGEHDAAIVPVFEYLRRPELYRIVPGVSIAAHNAVYSVMLFSSVAVEKIKRVHLDASSLTSVNLLKVLLAERGLQVEFVSGVWTAGSELRSGEAALLIGDPAILERGKHPVQVDLGLMWKELTGLPFVFAAWLVQRGAWERPINTLLQDAKEWGVARLGEIAREAGPEFGVAAPEAERYFRENLCYDLGEAELGGWRRFAELCAQHGLTESVPQFHMHAE